MSGTIPVLDEPYPTAAVDVDTAANTYAALPSPDAPMAVGYPATEVHISTHRAGAEWCGKSITGTSPALWQGAAA